MLQECLQAPGEQQLRNWSARPWSAGQKVLSALDSWYEHREVRERLLGHLASGAGRQQCEYMVLCAKQNPRNLSVSNARTLLNAAKQIAKQDDDGLGGIMQTDCSNIHFAIANVA